MRHCTLCYQPVYRCLACGKIGCHHPTEAGEKDCARQMFNGFTFTCMHCGAEREIESYKQMKPTWYGA